MHRISSNKLNEYYKLYQHSVLNRADFWQECAKEYLTWHQEFTQVYNGDINSFSDRHKSKAPENHWFVNGKLNACYNCLDRHLPHKVNKVAYYWQGDELSDENSITYGELSKEVCKFANVLLNLGIKTGDRICLYLPLCIEVVVATLACARIGAVHTVVFAGFSATALAERIQDAECCLLITTSNSRRGGKQQLFTDNLEQTVQILSGQDKKFLNHILCVNTYYSRDEKFIVNDANIKIHDYQELVTEAKDYCEPVWLDSQHPLFILYTSGSTGKPKGVLHTLAGYLLYATYTFNKVFNTTTQDVYWCTADLGWIAGHSYVLYGPLANGTTSVIFSGTPNYPNYDIFWRIIDKYQVTVFYTAPTAIRALMREGPEYLESTNRQSLRLLGTVGEPINPQAWDWYFEYVGKRRCAIIDTWWQTETGATMIAPLDDITIQKPGCAMLPFYGLDLAIIDDDMREIKDQTQGHLVIKSPWPGMLHTVYKQHERFVDTYFKPFPGYFYTGDFARRDEEGNYWLLGRSDDVLNIAGHRLGTAEVESALVAHDIVSEAGVVAVPDGLKGEILYAFVTLISDHTRNIENAAIENLLKQHVRFIIGPIAVIKTIRVVNDLPKTRSGKIMRRILRNAALGETKNFGDTSTLANPESIIELLNNK